MFGNTEPAAIVCSFSPAMRVICVILSLGSALSAAPIVPRPGGSDQGVGEPPTKVTCASPLPAAQWGKRAGVLSSWCPGSCRPDSCLFGTRGFHAGSLDAGHLSSVRLLPLPPYSPELNPVERVGDLIKDATDSRVFGSLEEMEQAIETEISPLWLLRSGCARWLATAGSALK